MPFNIELGSGGIKRPGFTTLDVEKGCDKQCNLNDGIPLQSNSVDLVYSQHVLEHFWIDDLLRLLAECHRVLKPFGKFSACVPDASVYIEGYSDPKFINEEFCKYKPAFFDTGSKIDAMNYICYMDKLHRMLFDKENIVKILIMAGFKNVRIRAFDPALDNPDRLYESLYVEGEKW